MIGKLLGIFLIFILVAGCPKPDAHIWFVKGEKLLEELTLEFPQEDFKIKLRSFSGLGFEDSPYLLEIRIEVDFLAEKISDLLFWPDSVRVFLEDFQMRADPRDPEPITDTLTEKKYLAKFDYLYDMRTDSTIIASVYSRKGFKLKILLDKFIYYRGIPLPIDTIYAIEKQQFWHW